MTSGISEYLNIEYTFYCVHYCSTYSITNSLQKLLQHFALGHSDLGTFSFFIRYIRRSRVEEPDIVIGIHPGLHADGVYEFWEPTIDLLLDKGIKTVFTVLSKEEFVQTLEKLDRHFVKYIYKGPNSFASRHVKQTPHEPNLMWSSNMFTIIFKVTGLSMTSFPRSFQKKCKIKMGSTARVEPG